VDRTVEGMGLMVLKTPVRAPQANAFCERVIGTIRRECLDFIIAINEGHVRAILREWVTHYNRRRPHASLGPGIRRVQSLLRSSARHPAVGFQQAAVSRQRRS